MGDEESGGARSSGVNGHGGGDRVCAGDVVGARSDTASREIDRAGRIRVQGAREIDGAGKTSSGSDGDGGDVAGGGARKDCDRRGGEGEGGRGTGNHGDRDVDGGGAVVRVARIRDGNLESLRAVGAGRESD